MSRHGIIGPDGHKPVFARRKTLVDAPLLGAMPDALASTVGTVTHAGIATTTGYVQVATAAEVGAGAELSTVSSVRLSDWGCLYAEFEAVGLASSTPTVSLSFGFRSGAGPNAAQVFTLNQGSSAELMTANGYGGTSETTNLNIRNGYGAKRYNIGIGVDVSRKVGWYTVGDQAPRVVPLPNLIDLANVRPTIRITTPAAVTQYFRCGRLALYGEYA